MSSHAKRCNGQDIFLSSETKQARTFDTSRREGPGPGKGGLRGWGGAEEAGSRGWGGGYENDSYKGKGKGSLRGWEDVSGKSRGKGGGWEDGFAAGFALAAGGGKGGGSYGRDNYSSKGGDRDRSRSPAGRWGHDLWASDRGGSGKSNGKGNGKGSFGWGGKGSWGGDKGGDKGGWGDDRGVYANFGSSAKGKNGKGSKDGGKGTKGGKKGRGPEKGREEEAPDPDKLDADLDKYFGKESSEPVKAKAAKDGGKESATELDSQLNDYFGEAKPAEGGNTNGQAEKRAEETKPDEGGKKDEKMEDAAKPEEKAAETAKS